MMRVGNCWVWDTFYCSDNGEIVMNKYLSGLICCLILCVFCDAAESGASRQPSNGKVKVFILAGQSNMEGKAKMAVVEHQAFKGDNQARYKKFTAGQDKWKERDHVWIKFFDRHGKLTVGYGSPGCAGPISWEQSSRRA